MITYTKAVELFDCNPTAGVLKWTLAGPRKVRGKLAGCVNGNGYMLIQINNRKYCVHRIVWLIVHGKWPKGEIDHINGNRADNRLVNLREVTRQENCQNAALCSNNTSGVAGVHWHKRNKKWVARLRIGGKRINLGHYSDWWHAVCARKDAEFDHGYHLNHGRTA